MSKPRHVISFNIQNKQKMAFDIKLGCNLGCMCDLNISESQFLHL